MKHRATFATHALRQPLCAGLVRAGLAACLAAAPMGCGNSESAYAGPQHDASVQKDAQPEVGFDAPAGPDGSDAPLLTFCQSDKNCEGSKEGAYCDVETGKCAACRASDDSGCAEGFRCDPAKLQCVVLCKAGEFGCSCNQVMKCDPGPPAAWVPETPEVICDPQAGQACSAKTGACVTLEVTGTTTPTGSYFQYAVFTPANSEFKGGCGLDSDGDKVYVNRDGNNLDVYRVTIEDTDGDGKLEPNQHPDNPNAQGPMENRLLTYLTTYTKADDKVPLGIPWDTEILALSDRIVSNGPTPNGSLTEYMFATKASTVIGAPAVPWSSDPLQILGYGDKDKAWYAGDAYARRVYSYCEAQKTWVAEFKFPSLAGDHFDGLELVVAPKTQVQYVYVSDMTSNFLGQYRRDGAGGWVQENLFKYNDGTGSDVEGMGFGALNHFWVGNCGYGGDGVHRLYEIGGGDMDVYTDPVE